MRLTARTFFMLRSFASVIRLVAIAAMAPILALSTAAQQFPNPPMLTTAEDPNGLATADWNGDGYADLAYVTTGNTPVLHLLMGDGKGGFTSVPPTTSGLIIDGDVRDLKLITVGKQRLLLSAINDSKMKVFSIKK